MKLTNELEALEQRAAALAEDPELHLSMRSWRIMDENSRKAGRETQRVTI